MVGANGTGGLLTIYAKNVINIGKIASNGTRNTTNTTGTTGGSSGGGSINIFYSENYESTGTITTISKGNGGMGSISIGQILKGSYISKYTNY